MGYGMSRAVVKVKSSTVGSLTITNTTAALGASSTDNTP